jgi:hypothetical protein
VIAITIVLLPLSSGRLRSRCRQNNPGGHDVANTDAVVRRHSTGRDAAAPPAAYAQSDTQVVIDCAHKTLANLRHDTAFGTAAHSLRQARAVLIVPRLLKGGFFLGGEGGEGVLMVQARDGTWSNPAFYGIGGASFGLQVGGEQSELVLLVMTQKGPDGLLNDHFKIGAQGGSRSQRSVLVWRQRSAARRRPTSSSGRRRPACMAGSPSMVRSSIRSTTTMRSGTAGRSRRGTSCSGASTIHAREGCGGSSDRSADGAIGCWRLVPVLSGGSLRRWGIV